MSLPDPPVFSPAVQMVVAMCVGNMNRALADANVAPSHREKNEKMREAVTWAKRVQVQVPKEEIPQYMSFETFFHVLQVTSIADKLDEIHKRDKVLHKTDEVRRRDKRKQRMLLELMLAAEPPRPGAGPARHKAKASAAAHPYKAARALKNAPRTSLSDSHAGPDTAITSDLDADFLALFAKTKIEEAKPAPPDDHAANVDNVCEQLFALHLPKRPAPSVLVARSNHREPLVGKPYARPAPKTKRA
ncbi:hypothetical protein AURDEDRAFT_114216 [Auricularia subglabra TFB-10046 SS5]|nr:hypothetical protein AURDEDRAFT_114216 [Auricularia subglabra TFB-10046 SS5]